MSVDRTIRVPPQSLEAERCLLGSILLQPDVLDDVCDIISAADFYGKRHEIMFKRLTELYNGGQREVDAAILGDALSAHGEFAEAGGFEYLYEILATVPHSAHARHYAEIVVEKAERRRLIAAATEQVESAFDESLELDEIISQSEQSLSAASERRVRTDTATIAELGAQALERILLRRTAESGSLGITTGFKDLDRLTTGFQPTELTILAARPSMGKTALAGTIAYRIAKTGVGVLFFSLEQKPIDLAERVLAATSRVSSHALRLGSSTDLDIRKLEEAERNLRRVPFLIDQSPERSISQIVAITRREYRKRRVRVLIVDYLQLVAPFDRREPREQQVARISRALKVLARELNIIVIALAQLNRTVENRDSKRPRLADLRESGAIEQDADLVLLLHRPEAYDSEDHPGEAEIIVAKNRSGPTDSVFISWQSQYMRFDDRSNEPDPAWINAAFR